MMIGAVCDDARKINFSNLKSIGNIGFVNIKKGNVTISQHTDLYIL